MMAMWFVLIILVIGIVWLIKKKPLEEVQQQPEAVPSAQNSVISLQDNEAEDELIAVIAAAIAQSTNLGSAEFKILKIRQQSENWVLTARQNITYTHL